MIFGTVAGCCAAINIHNVGNAHSHKRASCQEEWDLRFKGARKLALNMCITNVYQDVERKYLDAMGFDTRKVGSLYMSTISYVDLHNYLQKRAPDLKKYEEELQAKKKEAEAERKAKFSLPTTSSIGDPATGLPLPANLTPDRTGRMYRNGIYMGIVWESTVRGLAQGLNLHDFRHKSILRDRIFAFYGVRGIVIYNHDRCSDIRRRIYDVLYRARQHV